MKAITNPLTGDSGSALIISILVLFILTVLGMALMMTTTTETQIAANYRWGEMAFFNADAALEYGKNVLATYAVRDGDFRQALPPARDSSGMNVPPTDPNGCADATTAGCRDYQYSVPERNMTVYIGRVLRDINGGPIQYDFRQPQPGDTRGDIDRDGTQDIMGSVTVWVRRPLTASDDYGATDDKHDWAILTAEGTAPNFQAVGAGGNAASVRRLEMTIRLPDPLAGGDKYADGTKGSDEASEAAEAGNVTTTVQ